MRINFLAGAGAGKSTTAAWLFSELKKRDYSVELITEYVKSWAYQKRMPQSFDQVYLFGKQLHYEDKVLSSGIEHIITDSPIYLSHVYAKMYSGIDGHLLALAKLYEEKFPSISIYLERRDKQFKKEGRWGSLEDALRVDQQVLDFCQNGLYKEQPERFLISNWKEEQKILQFVCEHLERARATTGETSLNSADSAPTVGTP